MSGAAWKTQRFYGRKLRTLGQVSAGSLVLQIGPVLACDVGWSGAGVEDSTLLWPQAENSWLGQCGLLGAADRPCVGVMSDGVAPRGRPNAFFGRKLRTLGQVSAGSLVLQIGPVLA